MASWSGMLIPGCWIDRNSRLLEWERAMSALRATSVVCFSAQAATTGFRPPVSQANEYIQILIWRGFSPGKPFGFRGRCAAVLEQSWNGVRFGLECCIRKEYRLTVGRRHYHGTKLSARGWRKVEADDKGRAFSPSGSGFGVLHWNVTVLAESWRLTRVIDAR